MKVGASRKSPAEPPAGAATAPDAVSTTVTMPLYSPSASRWPLALKSSERTSCLRPSSGNLQSCLPPETSHKATLADGPERTHASALPLGWKAIKSFW